MQFGKLLSVSGGLELINRAVLIKLAEVLNNNQIVWGIGGSYLLQLHGIYSNPNDLDIWVQPKDMHKTKELFSSFERIGTSIQLPEKYHFKMKYYDTEVEFISCFIVVPNKNKFEYYISSDNIRIKTLDNGFKIPCTYLEDWYIVYKLLGREEKARIIEKVFTEKKEKLSINAIYESLKDEKNCVQKRVVADIQKLIINSLQLTLFDEKKVGNNNENKKTSSITFDTY